MTSAIKDMLDNLINNNQAEAQDIFNDIMSAKVTDVLDQKKIEVAQQLGANDAEIQAD